jgi:hypothetical protein
MIQRIASDRLTGIDAEGLMVKPKKLAKIAAKAEKKAAKEMAKKVKKPTKVDRSDMPPTSFSS